MLGAQVLKRFDFFPAFDFGKIWRLIKVQAEPTPTRPPIDSDGRIKPVAHVVCGRLERPHPGDVAGSIYVLGNRAVFWGREGSRLDDVSEARYLSRPLSEVLGQLQGRYLDYNNLGPLEEKISVDEQHWILRAYYGATKAAALLANTHG